MIRGGFFTSFKQTNLRSIVCMLLLNHEIYFWRGLNFWRGSNFCEIICIRESLKVWLTMTKRGEQVQNGKISRHVFCGRSLTNTNIIPIYFWDISNRKYAFKSCILLIEQETVPIAYSKRFLPFNFIKF